MIIKPQDIVVLVKLLAQQDDKNWSQHSLAFELCLSPSQINSAFKRLVTAGLITPYHPPNKRSPLSKRVKNFLFMPLNMYFLQN